MELYRWKGCFLRVEKEQKGMKVAVKKGGNGVFGVHSFRQN